MSAEVGAIQAKREGVIAEQPGAAYVVKYRDPATQAIRTTVEASDRTGCGSTSTRAASWKNSQSELRRSNGCRMTADAVLSIPSSSAPGIASARRVWLLLPRWWDDAIVSLTTARASSRYATLPPAAMVRRLATDSRYAISSSVHFNAGPSFDEPLHQVGHGLDPVADFGTSKKPVAPGFSDEKPSIYIGTGSTPCQRHGRFATLQVQANASYQSIQVPRLWKTAVGRHDGMPVISPSNAIGELLERNFRCTIGVARGVFLELGWHVETLVWSVSNNKILIDRQGG